MQYQIVPPFPPNGFPATAMGMERGKQGKGEGEECISHPMTFKLLAVALRMDFQMDLLLVKTINVRIDWVVIKYLISTKT